MRSTPQDEELQAIQKKLAGKPRAKDDLELQKWTDPLLREPWMRIARRDPPPGFSSVDFDPTERQRRSRSPPPQRGTTAKQGGPGAKAAKAAADVPPPSEPWLRQKIPRREPWQRESWMAIAKRDPPPVDYTVAPKPKAKPPSVVQEVQAEKKLEAQRRIDAKMAQEMPMSRRAAPPPSMPKFLRREPWSSIAERDPPPLDRTRVKQAKPRRSTSPPAVRHTVVHRSAA